MDGHHQSMGERSLLSDIDISNTVFRENVLIVKCFTLLFMQLTSKQKFLHKIQNVIALCPRIITTGKKFCSNF